ncbi:MAG: tRNA (N(6)-L-threonylcarbamoyladenosine(37)-C(2))-methylthiotransferase MtaB [Weeksellaceae bacterium]|nr:tRNA (N(6)-L-threonylcarbamoyladenosine(37)-C(2))-methylthiotransferase MtaB [Weeksellaceae bacterium]
MLNKSAAYHTLGCKLNFAETSTIARSLQAAGYATRNFEEKADIYVINTCSVTQNADKECKQIVKRAKKANPDGHVVVVGCYAQLKPNEIAGIKGVDLVLGANEKFNIPQFLQHINQEKAVVHSCEIAEVNAYDAAYSIGDRTRAFLKVQDGCDYKCTYCTIPLARGISRSDTIENILLKAEEIAAQGIAEIVLTGVNTGDYGKGEFGNKKHDSTFPELVARLDAEASVKRLRISSIEPNLLKDEIIEITAKATKFVPHFHIPLQSGSDKILGLMKRRYQSALYRDRVEKIKSLMTHACIGVDVIVGFPGETEEEFLKTYTFLQELPVSYFHVFTYSERDNTEAAEMSGVVPMDERKQRNKMLRILSEKKRLAFYQENLGTTRAVLWEAENRDGMMQGYTDNYVRVSHPYDEDLVNTITPVELAMLAEDGTVLGQILQKA